VVALMLSVFAAGCSNVSPDAPDVEATMSAGERIFRSEGCANCHGERGQGDVGPALTGLLATFPSCQEQMRWVSLGSANWSREVGASYGALGKPVRGGMPGFGSRLSDYQVAQVVSFTRSSFTRGDPVSVLEDCF